MNKYTLLVMRRNRKFENKSAKQIAKLIMKYREVIIRFEGGDNQSWIEVDESLNMGITFEQIIFPGSFRVAQFKPDKITLEPSSSEFVEIIAEFYKLYMKD